MASLPGWLRDLPFRVVASYVFDYVIVVVLLVIFYLVDKIDPFHQPFSLNNYTLQYPHKDEDTITVTMVGVLAGALPAVVMLLYCFVVDGIFSRKKTYRSSYTLGQRAWEFNCGLLGLGLAVSSAFAVTGSLKNLVGKPRPDAIARCKPRPNSRDRPVHGLSTIDICTQTDQFILQDGFRSFPSGHSSVAFAGLYYLSLYLSAKLHIFDSKGEVWKVCIAGIPVVGAAVIAGTRIMDARHHPFDVVTGSLLGVLTAWGSYRQYFPAVTDATCKGRAYPVRSWGGSSSPDYSQPDGGNEKYNLPSSHDTPMHDLEAGTRPQPTKPAEDAYAPDSAYATGQAYTSNRAYTSSQTQTHAHAQNQTAFSDPYAGATAVNPELQQPQQQQQQKKLYSAYKQPNTDYGSHPYDGRANTTGHQNQHHPSEEPASASERQGLARQDTFGSHTQQPGGSNY